jgi:hypothetical protein
MNITIDGAALDFTLENEKTLGEVLGQLEKWLLEQGRTTAAVSVDGTDYPAEKLDAAFALPVEKITQVDIRIADSARYGKELAEKGKKDFAALEEKLPGLTKQLEDFSLDAQTGKETEAAGTLTAFADYVSALLDILENLLYEQKEDTKLDAAVEKAKKLAGLSKELLETYQSQDYVSAVDLCEYEAAPALAELVQSIKEIVR